MIARRRTAQLLDRWSLRAWGAALVAGLHGAGLWVAWAVGPKPTVSPSPRAVQVRLMHDPGRREPALTPRVVAPALRAPASIALPPLPEISIESPQVRTIALPTDAPVDRAPQPTDRADMGTAEDVGTNAQPEYLQHVEYVQFEPPLYPSLSRRLGEQGLVVVRVHIDELGRPVEVTVSVSSGFLRLDEAAVRAVRAARFRPRYEGHRARPAFALVPIRFTLS